MDVNALRYDVICIFNPLVDYHFLMHGFITLSDATSYDKYSFNCKGDKLFKIAISLYQVILGVI